MGETVLDCDVHEDEAAAQKAEDTRQLMIVLVLVHLRAHVLTVARLLLHLGDGLVVPSRVFRSGRHTRRMSRSSFKRCFRVRVCEKVLDFPVAGLCLVLGRG